MKLFIANMTQQVQDFCYRVPESTGLRTQRIDVGQQIQISGDLSTPQIEEIVNQHARYGMVHIDEIDRHKPYIGLVFSTDRPVTVNRMSYGIQHNRMVLVERGKEIRQETAVALHQKIEQNPPEGMGNLKAVHVTTIEEESKSNPNPTFAEEVHVDPKTPPTKPRSGGRHRKSS
jgi:hypothetical protein